MLDQLYYFSEVYRQRSISRAADFLHISRQALSHSIKTLENDLGVELFVREKDGVTPTNAAESLFKSSQVILDEEAVIRKNMLAFTQNATNIRRYSICAPMFYVNYYGEELITQLSQCFPEDMFIMSTIKNSDDSGIAQKDINIQIKLSKQNRKSMKVPQDYQCLELLKLPLYIWVHASNPLAVTEDVSYAMLRTYPVSILKNTFNGTEFSALLNLGYDPVIEVQSNFKDSIRKFSHYTIDYRIGKDGFLLEGLLGNDPEFVRVKTLENIYVYVIYKKIIDENITSFIIESLKKSFLA